MTQITHTISHINKLSSKNDMKLRIHNCDNDFQIDSGASVNVVCERNFNKLKKKMTLRRQIQNFLHMG